MKLQQCITQFIQHADLECGKAQKTLRNYSQWLGRFRTFAGDVEMSDVTVELIREYRIFLREYEWKPGAFFSVKNQAFHLTTIRQLLKYCAQNEIPALYPDSVPIPAYGDKEVTPLSKEEVQAMMNHLSEDSSVDMRNRLMFLMLLITGLRISELCGLKIEQLDLSRRTFMIIGKGGKPRACFITKELVKVIAQYIARRGIHSPYLFPGRNRQKPLTKEMCEVFFRDLAKKAGITRKVTPHLLRHTAATDLIVSGSDVTYVQRVLGHSSLKTTQGYINIANPLVLREFDKHSPKI